MTVISTQPDLRQPVGLRPTYRNTLIGELGRARVLCVVAGGGQRAKSEWVVVTTTRFQSQDLVGRHADFRREYFLVYFLGRRDAGGASILAAPHTFPSYRRVPFASFAPQPTRATTAAAYGGGGWRRRLTQQQRRRWLRLWRGRGQLQKIGVPCPTTTRQR